MPQVKVMAVRMQAAMTAAMVAPVPAGLTARRRIAHGRERGGERNHGNGYEG